MPQVPYSPVPTISAQDNPTPRYSINTPGDAFGVGMAASQQNLGKSLEQAGNELFVRANAMQELANHSEASLASADYLERTAKLSAEFNSLQGKDAVEAFPGYIKSIKDLRQSTQNSLSNPASQRMFESSSLNTMGRTIFNGAGHAATENKRFAIGAASATVQANRNAALVNPENEEAFQAHVEETEAATRAQWELKGADDVTIANAQHKAVSDLWYDRIASIARKSPFTAQKLLDQATKDGKIQGEDIGKLNDLVRQQTHTVGARNISTDMRSGKDLSWGSAIVPISAAKNAIGTFESGGDYQSLGVEVFGKNGQSRGRALGKYQVMPENLPAWLKEAGLPSMTPQEFLNSPKAQDAVFETVFGRYMKETGSFNDAASMWFTGKPVDKAGGVRDANGTSVPDYLANTNAILARSAGLNEQVAKGRQIASNIAPNDPLMADYAEQRIIADHNREMAIKRDTTYTTRQTVESGLIGGQDGKLPTTVEELIAQSPDMEAAWQNLQPSDRRRYLGVLARNAKGDSAPTPEKLTKYQQLKGLAQSDPAKFLDENVVEMDFPLSWRKELINLQIKKKANAEQDPRVTHAMSVLSPTLNAAGISRRSDEQGYFQFVGALQGALDQYAEENKKPADAKAIQEIGTRLLQTQAGTGWFGTNVGASRVFNVAVPDEAKKAILADPFWAARGIVPSDDQIQRIYTRQLYNKLYGGKPKAPTASAAPSPQPPVSQ